MAIWLASGNAHKKKELVSILGDYKLLIPSDAGLAFDPDETGSSFHENALIKASALYKLLCAAGYFSPGDAVISDDSGICVDALGGRPGIYSARYAGPPGSETGRTLNDSEKNSLLLAEMENNPNRGARFVCAMVLLFSAENYYIAQETLEGCIAEKAGGSGGFGYDPILFIPELGRTVAELSEEEKNRISHRAKAAKHIANTLMARKQQIARTTD